MCLFYVLNMCALFISLTCVKHVFNSCGHFFCVYNVLELKHLQPVFDLSANVLHPFMSDLLLSQNMTQFSYVNQKVKATKQTDKHTVSFGS